MEGKPERIVDYFVVVGLPSKNITPFKVELIEEIGEGSLKLAPLTNLNPITDIALVTKKNENIPKGFKYAHCYSNYKHAHVAVSVLYMYIHVFIVCVYLC